MVTFSGKVLLPDGKQKTYREVMNMSMREVFNVFKKMDVAEEAQYKEYKKLQRPRSRTRSRRASRRSSRRESRRREPSQRRRSRSTSRRSKKTDRYWEGYYDRLYGWPYTRDVYIYDKRSPKKASPARPMATVPKASAYKSLQDQLKARTLRKTGFLDPMKGITPRRSYVERPTVTPVRGGIPTAPPPPKW